jgi:hypothetical protein
MMRVAIWRAAAVAAVAALAVAGCGSQRAAPPAATHATPPVAGQDGSAVFVARARQGTAQRDRSRAARLWRVGLVLPDPPDLSPVPPGAGFSSQREKDAFGSGHFRLAGTLPAGPLPGLVRWAGGTTLRLPVLTARAAFAERAAQRPCGGPGACGQLTVTGARPGVVTVRTSRVWPACLPGVSRWRAGLGGQRGRRGAQRSGRPARVRPDPGRGPEHAGVTGLTAVSADGSTLTLTFTGSACDAAWGAYRYQSNTTVVAGSWEKPAAGTTPCPAVGMARAARVTLSRPLGTRVILDVASGVPLVAGYQIP